MRINIIINFRLCHAEPVTASSTVLDVFTPLLYLLTVSIRFLKTHSYSQVSGLTVPVSLKIKVKILACKIIPADKFEMHHKFHTIIFMGSIEFLS